MLSREINLNKVKTLSLQKNLNFKTNVLFGFFVLFIIQILTIQNANAYFTNCGPGGTGAPTLTYQNNGVGKIWDVNGNWWTDTVTQTNSGSFPKVNDKAVAVAAGNDIEARWNGAIPTDLVTGNPIQEVGCIEVNSGRFKPDRTGDLILAVHGDIIVHPFDGFKYGVNSGCGPNTQGGAPGTFDNTNCGYIFELANGFKGANVVRLNGTQAQTLATNDPIENLEISNNTTVTLTKAFTIFNTLYFSGTTTTLNIDADLTIDADDDWYGQKIIIPSGITVKIRNSSKLTASYGLTIQNGGKLIVEPGSKLIIGNGNTDSPANNNGPNADVGRQILQVDSGGQLILQGAAGNVASIESRGVNLALQTDFTFNMNGILNARYFKISGMDVNGVNVGATGIVQKYEYGDIYNLQTNSTMMKIASGSSIPANMYSIGIFESNGATGVTNINANATWCASNTTYLDQWVGTFGSDVNDFDPQDANGTITSQGCITWGAKAGTQLLINNVTESQFPEQPELDTRGAIFDYTEKPFLTLAFSLNQTSTATDITSITLTQIGTIPNSDIAKVYLVRDGVTGGAKNCIVDATAFGGSAGTNAFNPGDIATAEGASAPNTYFTGSLSGAPGKVTFTIPAGVMSLSNTTQECFHVVVDTIPLAKDGTTVQFEVTGTADVSNSQNYNFSNISGPPVSGQFTNIRGGRMNTWEANDDNLWSDITAVNGNWKRNLPTSGEHCFIGSAAHICTLDIAAGNCLDLEFLTNGTFDFSGNNKNINVFGNLLIGTNYTFLAPGSTANIDNNPTGGYGSYAGGTLSTLTMTGAAGQTIAMSTVFPGHLTIANTQSLIPVTVTANSEISGDLTITTGLLKIQSGATLTVGGNVTLNGGKLLIEQGGVLKMSNGRTLAVNTGATLSLLGDPTSNAKITAKTYASDSYNIVINSGATLQARYYTLENLGVAGMVINSGVTINSTSHLQDGAFLHPLNNSSVLLTINQNIPFDSITNITFDTVGSGANSITSVKTLGTATGTLSIDSYSGDLTGPSFGDDTANSYLISWLGAANTLSITQDNAGPTTVDPGLTYNMGRFSFQQALAGASYNDTDITSLKLYLTGTGSSNDISAVKAYYDSTCTNSGVLIGNGTFIGNPASINFSFGAGAATVLADTNSTSKACIYITYDISVSAVANNTVGVELKVASDVVNSQSYALSGSTPTPINLGTSATITNTSSTSTWVGSTSSDWHTASNWLPVAVPDKTKDCIIDSAPNNPTLGIGANIGNCRNITIGNGTVVIPTGTTLNIYGSYNNSQTGTVTQTGTGQIVFNDDGVTGTIQTINSNDVIKSISFNKTAASAGSVSLASNVTITDLLTISVSSTFEFVVPNASTLTLNGGLTIIDGFFNINSGGILDLGAGTTIDVQAAGVLKVIGNATTDAKITSSAGFFNATINGGIWAQYYQFDKVANAGVLINSGATISPTYHLHDGKFSSPESTSTTFLTLNKLVPTNTMVNTSFNSGSTGFTTGVININTSSNPGSGTLSMSGWSGDIAGPSFENAGNSGGTYPISWTGAINDIDIIEDGAFSQATNVTAGNTVHLARYKFNQAQAGSFYNDANLTSLKLTLTGTNTATDFDSIKIYYDASCTNGASATGTLIGTGTPTGSPASFTYTLTGTQFTIPKHATTPPTVCLNVEVVVSAGAVDQNTVGVKLQQASHISNDQGYPISAGTIFAIDHATTSLIAGSAVTTWTGAANGIWANAGNWSAGVPNSTKNCIIANAGTPITDAPTAACKSITINSGAAVTLTGGSLTISGNFTNNNGSISQAGGAVIDLTGTSNQNITSSSQISTLTVSKTGGILSILGTSVSVNTLSLTGSNFEFNIPNAKELKVFTSTTIPSTATLSVDAGGLLSLGNNAVLTNNGVLKLVGTSISKAKVGSTANTSYYSILNNTGEINAKYYTLDHMQGAGLTIGSGSTINATNKLDFGDFTYPKTASTSLTLNKVVATLTDMNFDSAGATIGANVNIDTATGAVNATGTPGAVTISNYLGDLAGVTYENAGANYPITWSGAVNTLIVAQNSTGPASINAGSTVNMGRFSFKQNQPGSGYANTDLTSITLTLTGTATSSDISSVNIYYDTSCTGSGSLVGTGTFSGNPAKATIAIASSNFVIDSHATTPPTRCMDVEYVVSGAAIGGHLAGVKINASTDLVNSQSYNIDNTVTFPITLGTNSNIVGATTTSWTGANSINWFDALNWDAGVPSSSTDCNISTVGSFNPTIDGVINPLAQCKTLTNTNGTITIKNATGATLEIYSSLVNSGTINFNDGTLKMTDSTGSTQTITTTGVIDTLTFNKTAGGIVQFGSSSNTVNNFTIPASNNFEFKVPSTKTLTLTNGATITSGVFNIASGGTVKVGNGTIAKTITVNGGTFKTTGVSSASSTNDNTRAKVTVNGASPTWNLVSTSGTLDLVGFLFDYIGVNGVQANGTTTVSNLNGGLFENLSKTNENSQIVLNFNTTGTIPASASWMGFSWGPNNAQPAKTATYKLASGSCNGGTIDFADFYGDFQYNDGLPTPDNDKENQVNCTFNWSDSNPSPVSISSYIATAYNGAVSLDWITTYEKDHLGFNVYRANADGSIFQQINTGLIRNIKSSGSFKGAYNFIDKDVINGVTYYYYIEDVAVNGVDKKLHGPKTATPLASLAAAPTPGSGVNNGSNNSGTTPGSQPGLIVNPSYKDLGNGAVILTQTSQSLRIKITNPAPTNLFINSTSNPGYVEVDSAIVPGYSKTSEVGYPELLERTLLVEVHEGTTSAQVSGSPLVNTQAIVGKRITPAASWQKNGSGILVPAFNENSTAYSLNAMSPSILYSVDSTPVTVGIKKYIKITINPLQYNASTLDVNYMDNLTIDIGLNGGAWDISNPPVNLANIFHPTLVSNNLRIKVKGDGIFKVTHQNMLDSFVDGPFDGTNTTLWRAYYQGKEIPLDIKSFGNFSSGDYIRFYLPKGNYQEDDFQEVILSTNDLLNSANAPLRFNPVDSNPLSVTSSSVTSSLTTESFEQDTDAFFRFPLGDNVDHFFWKMIYAPADFPGEDRLDIPLDFTYMDSTQNVQVKVKVFGEQDLDTDILHDLGIVINGHYYTSKSFITGGAKELIFDIPSSKFFVGSNTLTLQALGTNASVGTYDYMYIDKVDVSYYKNYNVSGNIATISNLEANSSINIDGFSNTQINVLDITSTNNIFKLVNGTLSTVTGITSVLVNSGNIALNNKFFVFADGVEIAPTQMSLTNGYDLSLKDQVNGADFIIIGKDSLLSAVFDLVSRRETQGMRVKTVTLKQIYDEFSNGQKSYQAIKDFLSYARINWQAPAPQYLLLLGDGSYDPKDIYNNSDNSSFSMPLLKGNYFDISGDNWFVEAAGEYMPQMAVGRLPSENPVDIRNYVTKLLNYEDGLAAPSNNIKSMVFISDKNTSVNVKENFDKKNSQIASIGSLLDSKFNNTMINRSDYANDTDAKTAVLSSFDTKPFIINYYGHGAEDVWSDGNILTENDGNNLTNNELPIVVTWDCLNTYFYEPAGLRTIGESLIFNQAAGAIAFFGSAAMTSPPAQQKLATSFYDELGKVTSNSYKVVRIGEIAQNAKIRLGNDLYTRDIVRSFTLFGDPTLKIPEGAFTVKGNKQLVPEENQGGGGCAAFAGNSSKHSHSSGILEILAMLFSYALIRRSFKLFSK